VNEVDELWKELVDSEFDDRVRLASADLHQGPGTRGDFG
jgi:hypothetical protein